MCRMSNVSDSSGPKLGHREWTHECIRRLQADAARTADTNLIKLRFPGAARKTVDLYLKDESTHPSGSLKHRLARSLFMVRKDCED